MLISTKRLLSLVPSDSKVIDELLQPGVVQSQPYETLQNLLLLSLACLINVHFIPNFTPILIFDTWINLFKAPIMHGVIQDLIKDKLINYDLLILIGSDFVKFMSRWKFVIVTTTLIPKELEQNNDADISKT